MRTLRCLETSESGCPLMQRDSHNEAAVFIIYLFIFGKCDSDRSGLLSQGVKLNMWDRQP